jgi:hypothetical protein
MPPSPARFDWVGHRRSHFLYGLKASEGPNVVYPLVSLRVASICPEGFLSIGRSRARPVRRKEGFQEVGLKRRLANKMPRRSTWVRCPRTSRRRQAKASSTVG